MDNNQLAGAQDTPQDEGRQTRLAYEAPQLIAYNQATITKGGATPVAGDFLGGGGATSYRS